MTEVSSFVPRDRSPARPGLSRPSSPPGTESPVPSSVLSLECPGKIVAVGLNYGYHADEADQIGRVGRRLLAGQVTLNRAIQDSAAPFGGFKKAANGWEFGEIGMHDFMKIEAVIGFEECWSC